MTLSRRVVPVSIVQYACLVVILFIAYNIVHMGAGASTKLPPLEVASHCDTAKFMGTWFVIAVKPTFLETTCSNAVERYTWLTETNPQASDNDINIDFQFNKDVTPASPLKSLPQKGWIQGNDRTNSAEWKVSPFWPVKMPYLILEVDEQCAEYTVIGYPSRSYCWIMARQPTLSAERYEELTQRLVDKHHYSLDGLRKVPQIWTREERDKRGLSVQEIPDSLLTP